MGTVEIDRDEFTLASAASVKAQSRRIDEIKCRMVDRTLAITHLGERLATVENCLASHTGRLTTEPPPENAGPHSHNKVRSAADAANDAALESLYPWSTECETGNLRWAEYLLGLADRPAPELGTFRWSEVQDAIQAALARDVANIINGTAQISLKKDTYRHKVYKLTRAHNQLWIDNRELRQEASDLKVENADVNTLLTKLESTRVERNELWGKCNRVAGERDATLKSLSNAENRAARLEKEHGETSSALDETKKNLANVCRRHNDIQAELSKARTERDKAKGALDSRIVGHSIDLHGKDNEIAELKADATGRDRERKALQNEASRCRDKIDVLEAEADEHDRLLAELMKHPPLREFISGKLPHNQPCTCDNCRAELDAKAG